MGSLKSGQCFVREISDHITVLQLRKVLTAKFGTVKELEINRAKGMATLEFTLPESARRAVITSLPVENGGKGGVEIENTKVIVEVGLFFFSHSKATRQSSSPSAKKTER